VFPWLVFLKEEDGEDMADSYISVLRYTGNNGTASSGEVSVGVNDEDTVIVIDDGAAITETVSQSAHDDSGGDYQNTSGFNAFAVIVLSANDSGTATRHVKIWDAPTTNSTSSATLRWEYGAQDTAGHFDAANVVAASVKNIVSPVGTLITIS